MYEYETTIINLVNDAVRNQSVRPLLLGGITSSGGGVGGPPGGFVGYLPQSRIAYDLSELSDSEVPVSGASLLDNLNHIRYALDAVSKRRTYTWVLASPVIGGVPGPRLPEGHIVTRVDSFVTAATSVTFNIEEKATPTASGVDIMTSDLVGDVDGAFTTTLSNSSLAAGAWLWVDISDVSGSPGQVVITLTSEIL